MSAGRRSPPVGAGVSPARLALVVLGLVACRHPDTDVPKDDTDVADTDTDVADTDTDVPRPAFAPPPDAEDVDPADGVVHVKLTAAALGDLVAFDGSIPGPTIRAKVGDTLIADVTNDLDEPTTVHWHGVHVPWDQDGVTWMQDPIEPGETRTYTFSFDRAGTFWYHPHFDEGGQVDEGMYGAIVVTDPADPEPDVDVVLVMDAGVEETGEMDEHGVHAPEGPWTVDGLVDPDWAVAAGTTVRARVINASNTGYLDLRWPNPRQIGSDQGLLAAEVSPGSLVLAPGDRADLEWDVGSEPFALQTGAYTLAGGTTLGDPVDLMTITPSGTAAAPAPLSWPFSGEAPSPDPGYADIVWVFQGDGQSWMINGETWPDVTIPEVKLGDDVVIEIRNLSPTEHPFHLHGNRFEVLSVDGVAPATKTVEDTVNVAIRSTVRLKLTADNPGDWMAHCHILPHAHDGMMTLLRVTDG